MSKHAAKYGKAIHKDCPRRQAMAALYTGGATLEEIAAINGISRERVRQLVEPFELERHTGTTDPLRILSVARCVNSLKETIEQSGFYAVAVIKCLTELGVYEALHRLWRWRRRRVSPVCWSDAELLQTLRDLAKQLGRTPTQKDLNISPATGSHTTYVLRFGSLRNAQIAAGLTPNRRGYQAAPVPPPTERTKE
jgi:hypothetical protein